jgi:hypothetical protein
MTFHDYLTKNLNQTVMITLSIDNAEPLQYNYWNWFHQLGEFHLLKNDYSIGHILYCGAITENNDGSILHSSKHYPKQSIMNFYFGGVSN